MYNCTTTSLRLDAQDTPEKLRRCIPRLSDSRPEIWAIQFRQETHGARAMSCVRCKMRADMKLMEIASLQHAKIVAGAQNPANCTRTPVALLRIGKPYAGEDVHHKQRLLSSQQRSVGYTQAWLRKCPVRHMHLTTIVWRHYSEHSPWIRNMI